ncbi:MAG: PQQ-binding-like beta-propeller repeat protein [Phycisphaerae bacterium]|nr:PQQ-binding-like beta-propeller repeat protein [Phycisphaerae bacterium]
MKKYMVIILACLTVPTLAQDWPTYRHDNQRSGTTGTVLTLPLTRVWQYVSPAPPQRAWAGPAKWDAFAALSDQRSMRDFDPAFYVTSARGKVYFGSSVDDSVHCLDLDTGAPVWQFRTDGPVRIPPTLYQDRSYFGSDDGVVYCVDARTGTLVWKYHAVDSDKLIAFNGKLISQWPCRSGVLVQDDTAYFTLSLLPWAPSYVCAVRADDAAVIYKTEHQALTAQAAMLASATRLYMPQGRQRPVVCDAATGRLVGGFGNAGQGGTFALLTPENKLVHGVGQTHGTGGELRSFNADTKDQIATFPSATCMVIQGDNAWFCSHKELIALDRARYMALQTQIAAHRRELDTIGARLKALKDQVNDETRALNQKKLDLTTQNRALAAQAQTCFLWKNDTGVLNTLICGGDTLYAGGENIVIAYSATEGKLLWQADVDGKVYGLAIANKTLLVSTDTGSIFCFAGHHDG